MVWSVASLYASSHSRWLRNTPWTWRPRLCFFYVNHEQQNICTTSTLFCGPWNIYIKLCGAEYHSRDHKLCSHSVVSQDFMEPECSLPRSQELSTCTCARPIQSTTPNPISKRSIILSIHVRLCLPSGLFPSGFHANNLYTFLFSPIRATCPTQITFFNLIILIILGEEFKLCSSSLCNFLHPPVTLSLFGIYVFLQVRLLTIWNRRMLNLQLLIIKMQICTHSWEVGNRSQLYNSCRAFLDIPFTIFIAEKLHEDIVICFGSHVSEVAFPGQAI
jgi:hypothetical protein